MQNEPRRSCRIGMTVMELLRRFHDDAMVERWFEATRWPDGRFCPDCASINTVLIASHKPTLYRCRDCWAHFSVRKGTVMQNSKVGLQKSAIVLYMTTTGAKGTSSMKLYQEVGIWQETAWFLMQRIWEGLIKGHNLLFPSGEVEADEMAVGGKHKNMSKELREAGAGRGSVGKAIVAGVKDRESKQASPAVVDRNDAKTLQGFVLDRTESEAAVYMDQSQAYTGFPRAHEAVNLSAGEYVRGDATVNGMEGFWSVFKRGRHGKFNHLSEKHLDHYVRAFTGRNNFRDMDTLDQMASLVHAIVGKRCRYADLVA